MSHVEHIRTDFVLKKAVQCLSIGPRDTVLYVGVDQRLFYDLMEHMAGECHGVDRDSRRARRTSRRFRRAGNILIQHGSMTNLPYPGAFFSKAVIHEFSALVSGELEARRFLDEIRRVVAPGGDVFIGGIAMFPEPFRNARGRFLSEIERWLDSSRKAAGIIAGMKRGIRRLIRSWRGSSDPEFMISEERFTSICREFGFKGALTRFELTHALSASRTDVALRREEEKGSTPVRDVTAEEGGRA